MAQSPRNPIRKLGRIENARSKHRVCGRQTAADDERSIEVCFQEQVYEDSGDEPAECHDRTEHHSHTGPVPLEVLPRQLHPNGENLDGEDYPRCFLGDVVLPSPIAWVNQVKAFRAKDDADERC